MPRHKMPTHTKRRLIAATVTAVALIGTAVGVGIYGAATAADGNRSASNAASQECLPEPGQTGSASATAPPESTTPPADPSETETPPPSDTSGTEAPAETETPTETQPPADTQTETQPAEEAPAEEAPAEEAPAEEAPETQGFKRQQPEAEEPQPEQAPPAQPAEQQETQGPSSGGSDTAPDESGAPPQTAPPAAPADATEKTFSAPDCTNQFGPSPDDFISIFRVPRANLDPRPGRNASRGTFTSRCGTNEGGQRNPDNFIVAPGVRNGAHHTHDYVGNDSADANSTNESLAAAGTTCSNGDKSTYFWPVVRVRDRNGGPPGDAENPHNTGEIQTPRSVSLQFRGNAQAKVVAMPRFIRILTGDAKSTINGGANANAKWTCTGFRDRFTAKYPLCPRGSSVMRVADFPSCWDGQNTDSANHRTHVVFPDRRGACPEGTQAIPQLRITLTYNLPRGRVFALDAFPEVSHRPETDHNDFVNVMSDRLMARAVDCINRGRNC
jgi:Domain of unknown function (DUF1996)